jgi:hypothetical protein
MAGRMQSVNKSLHTFARMHPLGHALAWLYQGRADFLAGRRRRANRAWRRSLAAAERLHMPYEQGLVYFEQGRWAEREDPERVRLLARAAELFRGIGAAYHLSLVEKEHPGEPAA